MAIYHFTTETGARGIKKIGQINCSPNPLLMQIVSQGDLYAVSLVDVTTPEGHGLPDGRKLTPPQATGIAHWTDAQGDTFCFDHTEYRLDIELDPDGLLFPAARCHSPQYFAAIQLTAWLPVDRKPTGARIQEIQDQINSGSLTANGRHWFYYFQDIPIRCVTGVHRKQADGSYQPAPWPLQS